MSTPDELRELVESYLAELALTPELKGLEESMRHALAGGGKRVRPVLCLATAEAAGAEAEAALPAAAALELVHNFSLVHDDLPALDDDELRRGRPSTWAHTARRSRSSPETRCSPRRCDSRSRTSRPRSRASWCRQRWG